MKIIYFLVLFMCSECFGRGFLQSCEKPQSNILKEHFKELKIQFNENSCFKLKKKLSTLKSFTEIIAPLSIKYESAKRNSWTQDFPYMYGLMDMEKKSFEGFTSHPLLFSENIEIFSEFSNISHLTYTTEYDLAKKNSLCSLINKLPYIKQVSTTTKELANPTSDKCISERGIEVIIRDTFDGIVRIPKSKIIGFEDYGDKFSNLKLYPHLKYLSVSDYNEFQGSINILSKRLNLTHLSLNINNVQDIENVSKLSNLTFLTIYCRQFSLNNGPFQGCKERGLTDIDFITRLQWLKYLDLSHNRINNVNSIVKLKNLNTLKLSYNPFEYFPDVADLSLLEELKLDGTSIKSFEVSRLHSNLRNLNLKAVTLTKQIKFDNLPKLEYLNLAETPVLFKIDNFILPKTLKILDVSGDGNGRPKDVEGGLSALIKTDVFKTNPTPLYQLFNLVPYDYYSLDLATFSNDYVLDLPELEVLLASHNQLDTFPDISKLPKLKVLKLEYNNIVNLPEEIKHDQLISIDLTGNKFERFPNLESFKRLEIIDLIGNNIYEVDNLSKLPMPARIGLSENKITHFPLITEHNFDYSYFELNGNPLIKGTTDCPVDSINASVSTFCNK